MSTLGDVRLVFLASEDSPTPSQKQKEPEGRTGLVFANPAADVDRWNEFVALNVEFEAPELPSDGVRSTRWP